jgi:hypothetical protein
MTTNGQMGHRPQWHITMTAARYMGVDPWELIEQPLCWTRWALDSMHAEQESERQKSEAAARRANRGKKH